MQQTFHLFEAGLISKEDHDAWLFYTVSLFKTLGGAEIWPLQKALIAPSFGQFIANHLAENPNHPSFIEINPLFLEEGDSDA